jgi:hypothetical protein
LQVHSSIYTFVAMIRSIILSLFCFLLLSGCIRPGYNFEHYTAPQLPDYSKEDCWAALPWRHDAADTVPPGTGLRDEQDSAKVDVFFIYPTLDYSRKGWNASVYDKKLNERIEHTTIRQQASVFNGSCKVYAPRYRQATLYSFIDKGDNGKKALDLAYTDIRQAFIYYMKNYNKGRPIIIAGHSQGALLSYRLLKEFFDTTALKQRLVVAYPIGYRMVKDSLKNLKPGDSATETGCYITWNTVRWGGHSSRGAFFKGVCVNPLSWKQDTNFVDQQHNLGSITRGFAPIIPGAVGAACRDGVLWVSDPPAKAHYFTFAGSYHIFDYSMFYMNLRANVAQRVKAYLAKHPAVLN